jgi:carbonic anhydrase/acetyltransferase-like protein (isoleucine patch superfamily)
MPVYELGNLRPVLGKDVFIAPNATVIGDVVLGDEASVWFGAVLRGDMYPIRIGARTNIQDNAVVHITADKAATTVGDDVTVGHSAIVHGCTIGSRCLVGMGSIVLDGAVIEDECFLAAGTLVAPGTRVPARSMVMGRPGKIVRALREAELDDIRSASVHYVHYAREFVRSLRLIDFPEKS